MNPVKEPVKGTHTVISGLEQTQLESWIRCTLTYNVLIQTQLINLKDTVQTSYIIYRLYQLWKVDVDMLNAVKNVLAGILSVGLHQSNDEGTEG